MAAANYFAHQAGRPSTEFWGKVPTKRLRRSMELLNETAPPLPWLPSAARGGWLLIPTGWTTLVLAVIFIIL
jgi:hypothetical protein